MSFFANVANFLNHILRAPIENENENEQNNEEENDANDSNENVGENPARLFDHDGQGDEEVNYPDEPREMRPSIVKNENDLPPAEGSANGPPFQPNEVYDLTGADAIRDLIQDEGAAGPSRMQNYMLHSEQNRRQFSFQRVPQIKIIHEAPQQLATPKYVRTAQIIPALNQSAGPSMSSVQNFPSMHATTTSMQTFSSMQTMSSIQTIASLQTISSAQVVSNSTTSRRVGSVAPRPTARRRNYNRNRRAPRNFCSLSLRHKIYKSLVLLDSRRGCTYYRLKQYMNLIYSYKPKSYFVMKKYIEEGLQGDMIRNVKGNGLNGSFRIKAAIRRNYLCES